MTNSIVDIEALFAPIPGRNPAGEDLRYSGLYDDIRKARRADEAFAQGEWHSELKVADWSRVIRLATEALATKTKDLVVSAWLSEALVKTYGFTGLRDGLRLTRGLLEQFWDNLYPEIDEEDLEARANSLAWMDQRVALAMKEVSVTESQKGEDYSYNDYQDSIQFQIPENVNPLDLRGIQRIDQVERDAAAEGKITSKHWRVATETTSRTFYEETHLLLSECWEELQVLSHNINEKFGSQAPELGTLASSLNSIRLLVEKNLREKRGTESAFRNASPASAREIEATAGVASYDSSSVHFTAHYPAELTPGVWSTLLVYAHVSSALGSVQMDSNSRLGLQAKSHRKRHATATSLIGSGAEITVVPEMPGCRFNPPQASFLWLEDWHRVEFRLQASPELPEFEQGTATNCRIAFYVGPVIVGEIKFGMLFTSDDESINQLYENTTTNLYQTIFISYSHEDKNVVEQLEKAYTVLGFECLRDLKTLRSGEKWNQALLKKIEEADIFQLCWSSAAKQSEYVKQEWQYALELNRDSFIRPVYWETPMPKPPTELMGIHFARLGFIQ